MPESAERRLPEGDAAHATAADESTTPHRDIELSWGIHKDVPGLRCLQAECPDELTQMIFAGPALFDESDPETLLKGPIGEMAVNEHRSRCEFCQAWEQAS